MHAYKRIIQVLLRRKRKVTKYQTRRRERLPIIFITVRNIDVLSVLSLLAQLAKENM